MRIQGSRGIYKGPVLRARPDVLVTCLALVIAFDACSFAEGSVQPQPGQSGAVRQESLNKTAGQTPATSADELLTDAIERRLEAAPGVPSYLIDVAAHNGVVTLSGNVDDLLAKERAGQLAETIRGVSQVSNQIKILPADREPWEIRGDVNDALGASVALQNDEIHVKVQDGFVTLSGRVDSWPERHLAQTLAAGIWGVRGVENKLRVAYGTLRSDAEIEADILSRISWDPWLKRPELKVDVSEGRVQMRGLVESAASRNRVYRDGWVSGVTSVDVSNVEVVPDVRVAMSRAGLERSTALSRTGRLTDEELQTAITQALHDDPLLMPAVAKVRVENGAVALSGTVSSLEAKRVAGEIARDFSDAEQIKNSLKVRTVPAYSDSEIRRNIERAFRRDSQLEGEPITVSVIDGQAYLSGRVDAAFQRSRAAQLAASVSGVAALQNNIAVPEANRSEGIFPSPASDQEIKQSIENQLRFDPLVNSVQIKVRAQPFEAGYGNNGNS